MQELLYFFVIRTIILIRHVSVGFLKQDTVEAITIDLQVQVPTQFQSLLNQVK